MEVRKTEAYYVLKMNGEVRRIAKIVDNALAYGFQDGKWVQMSGLLKIMNDVTDYKEISKAEAEKFMRMK